jgi:colicin import membrane protein
MRGNMNKHFLALVLLSAICSPQLRAGDPQDESDDLRSEIESTKERIEFEHGEREWDELEAQRKAEEARQQTEQAQLQAEEALRQAQQQTKEAREQAEQSRQNAEDARLDADGNAFLQQLQLRRKIFLNSLSPEDRAAYFAAEQEAARRQKWQREEAICHEPFQYREWKRQTNEGQTFLMVEFKERHLGDRKKEVEAWAKAYGAKRYKLWEHHKWNNLEWVQVVFFK